MGIKRFIFNRLFNKRQRRIIWQALLYSEYRYERRGNVDAAARVKTVINETVRIAGLKQQKFYESEVAEIVKKEVSAVAEDAKKRIENAYQEGRAAGIRQAVGEIENKSKSSDKSGDELKIVVSFVKPIEVDLEKCEDCEHKDDCPVKSALENSEDGGEKHEDEDTEEAEKDSQARDIPVEGSEDSAEKTEDVEESGEKEDV